MKQTTNYLNLKEWIFLISYIVSVFCKDKDEWEILKRIQLRKYEINVKFTKYIFLNS